MILAHSVLPSPGSSTIELPSAFAESGAYPPDRAPPGSPRQCSLPLACRHPPEGHQIGARKRRAPGNTILSQSYRRSVSTDRLNREGSQLAASLEGEPGPTPAGKTLPLSYPETRFQRERARDWLCYTEVVFKTPSRAWRARGIELSFRRPILVVYVYCFTVNKLIVSSRSLVTLKRYFRCVSAEQELCLITSARARTERNVSISRPACISSPFSLSRLHVHTRLWPRVHRLLDMGQP